MIINTFIQILIKPSLNCRGRFSDNQNPCLVNDTTCLELVKCCRLMGALAVSIDVLVAHRRPFSACRQMFYFFSPSLIDGAGCTIAPCVIEFFKLGLELRKGCSLSSTQKAKIKKKIHSCHPICFHWQKRLEQEKLQVLILGRVRPWPGRESSLFRQIERAYAGGRAVYLRAFHSEPAESSAPASRRHSEDSLLNLHVAYIYGIHFITPSSTKWPPSVKKCVLV